MRLFLVVFLCVFFGKYLARVTEADMKRPNKISSAEMERMLDEEQRIDIHIMRLEEIIASINARSES